MEKRRSTVGFWIVIIMLAGAFFVSFMLNIGLVLSHFSGSRGISGGYPVDQRPKFKEVWSYGHGDVKVARIPLEGVIMHGRSGIFGQEPDMVDLILSQIRAATNDKKVCAIILEVDSPGGGVTASDEIYNALMEFKKHAPDRKVIVFVRDLAASGAYYAAMAGDYIIAEPTSVVGSVGVIMQAMNLKKLGDKVGFSVVTITSGKNKDMLNPFEEVNPEHVALLQKLIDDMYDRFASIVMKSRGLDDRKLLDGRIFIAEGAFTNGFIDGIGYWEDAVEKTKELLGVKDLRIVRYNREMSVFQALLSAGMPRLPKLTAMELPRFMYLWKP